MIRMRSINTRIVIVSCIILALVVVGFWLWKQNTNPEYIRERCRKKTIKEYGIGYTQKERYMDCLEEHGIYIGPTIY